MFNQRYFISTNAELGQQPNIPIIEAIDEGNLLKLRELINSGADVDVHVPGGGKTPLHIACEYKYFKCVKELILAGVDVNAKTQRYFTPLHVAAQLGNADIIKILCETSDIDINCTSDVGCTPLHEAAANGHVQAVLMLLKFGADSTIRESRYYCTARDLARKYNRTEVTGIFQSNLVKPVKRLPSKLDQPSRHLQKTLRFFMGEAENSLPTVEVALRRAAAGLRPAVDGGMDKQTTILKYLISETKDINACSPSNGMTALHLAVTKSQIENIKLLLASGADPNVADKSGRTAKDYALSHSNLEINTLFVSNNQVELGNTLIFSNNSNSATTIAKFLRLIVEGEQDKVEVILQQDRKLALYAGDVTDLSGRTFNNITGLQYALWALDSHMWGMILKYLPENKAKGQLDTMKNGSWVEKQGETSSWQNLIDALNLYIEYCKQSKWAEAANQWNKEVGAAQRLLPVHIVNEYCRKDKSFGSRNDFIKDSHLPRCAAYKEWYSRLENLDCGFYQALEIGVGAKARRGEEINGSWTPGTDLLEWPEWGCIIRVDISACKKLLEAKIQLRQNIFTQPQPKNKQSNYRRSKKK